MVACEQVRRHHTSARGIQHNLPHDLHTLHVDSSPQAWQLVHVCQDRARLGALRAVLHTSQMSEEGHGFQPVLDMLLDQVCKC